MRRNGVGGPEGTERQAAGTVCVTDNVTSRPYERVREACHDLRQPIATINALASAALSESQLSPEISAWLELILAETRHLDAIVLDALGRTGAPMPLEVAAIVEEAVRRHARTSECVLDCNLMPVVVLCTAVDICRLIDNLISNAERATGGHGRVQITVAPRAGECLISVEDDGPGFGADLPSGWKLGLQVVHRLAGGLGGRVELGRSSMGGARVRLLLPRLAAQEQVS
jgi:signal transduction histidine kinase